MENLGFMVEGHGEYAGIPSFIGKILNGYFNHPMHNAQGIGNILKNLDQELIYFIKSHHPKVIIISCDGADAIKGGLVRDCTELKKKIEDQIRAFYVKQRNGSLSLPDQIIVVIAWKTYDSWLCSDIEGLKKCNLFDPSKLTETYEDVDNEIDYPNSWLKSKLVSNIDIKNKKFRKAIASSIDPNRGKKFSRSFRKFIKEVAINSPSEYLAVDIEGL